MAGFKPDAFISADLKPREKTIKVPDLQEWFEGQEAVWKIRGLVGIEVAQYQEAREKNRDMSAIAEGLVSSDKGDIVEAMRERLGIGDAVPDDIAKRSEVLVLGSVSPEVDNQIAIKLCETFPVLFYDITNQILSLTGEGSCLGKSPDSGKIQK